MDLKPEAGGLSQLVTNFKSAACCDGVMFDTTFQNLCIFLSSPVYPPTYRECALISAISILPELEPLINT